MSLLVVGLSHRSAPMDLLERVALGAEGVEDLTALVHRQEDVTEALVVATCNRTEVYADAHTFHGALAQIGASLATRTGVPLEELTEHLYVHYEDRAVSHLFLLACGLESMAVGESQVLGQIREALAVAQRSGRAGGVLNPLFQHALRVGKRAHAETDIDEVSRSLVVLGLERAARHLGDLRGLRAVLVGAGAMSGLAAATLVRAGVTDLTVVNRTREHADRLVRTHGGAAVDWSGLTEAVGTADLLITCTGAVGHVIGADVVARSRGRGVRPLVVLDLAMPRDVAPAAGRLPGVHLWGLAELRGHLAAQQRAAAGPSVAEDIIAGVQDLVTAEVAAYLISRRTQQVGPTLAALRARAATVVDAELTRLGQRLPELSEREQAEMRRTVQRVVDKLLHTPTVRVKKLVGDDDGGDYAHALRELFDLDPGDVATVSSPPQVGGLS